MTRRFPMSVPFLFALAGAGPLGYWLVPQSGAAQPKIAFVELHRIFEADLALREDVDRINARMTQVDQEMKGLREEVEKLKVERDTITDRTSEKYLRLSVDIEVRQSQVKALSQGMQALLDHENVQRNLVAYERYRKVIADLAKERGLDAVFRVLSPEAREPELRRRAAELGMVLYADPKLDVTEDVIKLLKTR